MKAKKKASTRPHPQKNTKSNRKGKVPPRANEANETRLRARKKVPRVDGKPGKPSDFTAHDAFLDALRVELDVHAACEASGLKRCTAYRHKKQDSAFSEAWDDIMEGGADQVEGKLTGRLINGVTKKKFTAAGEPVIDPETGSQYFEVEYDNGAALRFLAARRPEIYGDKTRLEMNGHLELSDEEIITRGRACEAGVLATLAASLKGFHT